MRQGNPLEPGGESAHIIQLRDALVCCEESLLRRVFGELRIAKAAVGDAVDHALEIAHQMIKGGVPLCSVARLRLQHPVLMLRHRLSCYCAHRSI